MKYKKIEVTLTDDMLGMSAANPDIYRDFIASKAPDPDDAQEELEKLSVDELVEKTMTIFPKDNNGNPFLWDYQSGDFLRDHWGRLLSLIRLPLEAGRKKTPRQGKSEQRVGPKYRNTHISDLSINRFLFFQGK